MSTTKQSTFPVDGKTAVQSVRRALADILASVGGDASQPQELARRFGLDKTLTWRIARVVREENAWEAVPHIPRKPSVKIFVRTMAKHGAPQERLDALVDATGEFDRFVELHSGDRETLEAMVSGTPSRSSEKRMEAFRKSGFQANAAVWGVRARMQFSLSMLFPGAKDGMLDSATLGGFVDLLRLRPDVPWAVASAIAWDSAGQTEAHEAPIPLNPDGLIDGAPLLPQFCSQPLPKLRTTRAPGGNSRFELTPGPVGNTAATTVTVGWKWPSGLSMHASSPGEQGEHGVHLSTPVEMAILDLLVHRSLTFAMDPVAGVYSELPSGPRYPTEGQDSGKLPMIDDVVDLGEGPPDMTTPEMASYAQLVEFAVKRMGYSINDFRGYRYRLRYPPIPTLAVLKHKLLP